MRVLSVSTIGLLATIGVTQGRLNGIDTVQHMKLIDPAMDTGTSSDGQQVVLVTGATGRTGSLAYGQLLKMSQQPGATVARPRALIRNATGAQEILNCTKCDASEGVYIGDVSNATLLPDEVGESCERHRHRHRY